MYFDRLKALYTKKRYHILPIKSGMVLELHENVGEGDTKRVQKFTGLVIQVKKPQNIDGTFTIRGQVAGMTVEKIYPLSFLKFEKVILLDIYRTRQSRIFFMRDKIGKGAKLKSMITPEEKDTDLVQIALAAVPKEVIKKEEKAVAATEKVEATPTEEAATPATEEKKDAAAKPAKVEKKEEKSEKVTTDTKAAADTDTKEQKDS